MDNNIHSHDPDSVLSTHEAHTERNAFKAHAARKLGAIALSAVLVTGSCGFTYAAVNQKWEANSAAAQAQINQLSQQVTALQNSDSARVVNMSDVTANTSLTPREIYAQNYEAIVSVSGQVKMTGYGGQVATGTASGSGFIISNDGYVVTNYHVVEGASSLQVTLSTGDQLDAKVIGTDPANDVAVLKIEGTDFPCVKLGSSDELYIGDMVVAIGNPLGSLTATLTVGYCSGKDREVTTDNTVINMIQTDAAINSGNSGGPLFNMYGEVVGITTAKYSGTTSSGASIEGVGFAIPIDDVMRTISDLKDFGYVTGAYLGVTVQNSDSTAAAYYGLPTGAYVVTVVDGYGAKAAGIQEKDIIVGLGDYEVTNVNDLTRALRHFNAGDTTTITIYRSGQRLTLSITLSERPQDLDSAASSLPSGESDQAKPSTGDYNEWYDYFFGDKKNAN